MSKPSFLLAYPAIQHLRAPGRDWEL